MDVACLGILVADLVARPIDEWPERGRLSLVDEMALHVGGCAANTGVALSKLGVKVGLLGKVGVDGLGDFLLKMMTDHGVDVRGVRRDFAVNTSGTMVMADSSGERSFLHFLGANAVYTPADVDWSIIEESKLLHVAGSLVLPAMDGEPTAQLLQKAKDMGKMTALDTVWDPTGQWMDLLGPSLPYIDYFLPSLFEAQALTGLEDPGDVAKRLHDLGVPVVALKMGEEGSYVSERDGAALRVPTFSVKCVDGTGAGDAFVGGFLAGVLQGLDLEDSMGQGNAAGALCATRMGGIDGVPDLEGLREFIRDQKAE